MTNLDVPIGVVPYRDLPAGGQKLEVLPLSEALARRWSGEAALTTYYVPEESPWPRLAKKHLRPLREAGGSVMVSMLVMDYDLHGPGGSKRTWESTEEVWDVMAAVSAADVPWPTAFYSTKHGLRLIYVLSRPLTPEDSERSYTVLQARFKAAKLEMDPKTKDWTRIFFLPFIEKEGEDLYFREEIFVETYPDRLLDPDELLVDSVLPVQPLALDGDRPNSETADSLLFKKTGGATELHKQFKALLGKGPDGPWLFDGQPLPLGPGERDDGIWKMVGRVMTRLWNKVEGLTPESIYALLRPCVALLTPDDQDPTKDWCEVLWDKVQRTWEKKHEEVEVKRVAYEERLAQMVAGFREQCRASGQSLEVLAELSGLSEVDFVRQHMMVSTGKGGVYLMQPDGYYLSERVALAGSIGRMQTMGMADLYGIYDRDGQLLKVQDIMAMRGVSVSRAVGALGLQHSELRNIGTSNLLLATPTCYLRTDVKPRFVPEVDTYLRQMAGDENYERLADWIGHALDLTKPICALSLSGAPGAGKSLLGEILGACFGPGQKNSHEVLTTDFNGGLLANRVVHIDEGLPSKKQIDELLRVYVSGGMLPVTKKGIDPQSTEVYPLVVFTANNMEALRTAIGSRDLDEHSHNALTMRILHMTVCEEAAAFFKLNKGRQMTANWITDECLGIQHFMWLHANRQSPSKWCGSGRFAVEGDHGAAELEQFRYQTVAAQNVISAILDIMCNFEQGGNRVIQQDDAGNFWVTSSGMKRYLQHAADTNLSINDVVAVLRKIGEETRGPKAACSYRLKPEPLIQFALEHGISCPLLLKEVQPEAVKALAKRLQ